MQTAPALFISHGAPTFALEPGAIGAQLVELGKQLVGLSAVLVVSPHWQTQELTVMSTPMPTTIHDFGGFPEPLYRLRYPSPGAPDLAAQALTLLNSAGLPAALDTQRGLDHGAWVPLLHLLPSASVPVFQVSLPLSYHATDAWRLGQALAPLRERGVMLVGSGSLTHNLYEVRLEQPDLGESNAAPYARQFADWARSALARRDLASLLDYQNVAPDAKRAHPTEEHFLPLPFAFGASLEYEVARVIEGGMRYGVLSMDAFGWGLPR